MLVLTRREHERVRIETPSRDVVWVHVLTIDGQKVRLGFDAPRDVKIWREEVLTDDR